jgi:hypothetical protein
LDECISRSSQSQGEPRIFTKGHILTVPRNALTLALRIVGLLMAALAFYLMLGVIVGRTASHAAHDSLVSFLALGDTGKKHRVFASLLEGQLAVSGDLAAEDHAHPVDALVMLGDNFYMHGLRREEIVDRVATNLVYPYCRFVQLDGSRSAEVSEACPVDKAFLPKRPIYAVLGNHDLGSPESAALQQDVVPEFVSNWSLRGDVAVVRELGQGVSLIMVNTEVRPLRAKERHELARALEASEGPWRIIAGHRPMAIGKAGNAPKKLDGSLDFEAWVAGAIREAGVHVHLYLSGHHHSLQVIEGGGELGPDLHVVVGSGARLRDIVEDHPKRVFEASELGFGRVDLVAGDGGESLEVSVFQSPVIPLLRFGGPKRVGQWSLTLQGDLIRFE